MHWCINNEYGAILLKEYTGIDENNHLIDINNIASFSHKKLKWLCSKCGNEWYSTVAHRTANNRGCPRCAGFKSTLGNRYERSFYKNCINNNKEYLIQEIVKLEETEELPDLKQIGYGSHKYAIWKCHICENEWRSQISNRTLNNCGCPRCSSFKKRKTTNLYTWCQNNEYGETILNEWVGLDKDDKQVDINTIAKGSGLKVQWKCSKCNNIWIADINHRTSVNRGCPRCAYIDTDNKSDLYTYMNLDNQFSKRLLTEFMGLDEYNNIIDPRFIGRSSSKRVKWKCSNCGSIWITPINDRVHKLTCCPKCNVYGTSLSEQFIYEYFKEVIGSNNVKNRIKIEGYEFDIFIRLIKQNKFIAIEYSPLYWHEGREHITNSKSELCNRLNVDLINIIDSKYNTIYRNDEIVDNIEQNNKSVKYSKLSHICEYITNRYNINTKISTEDIISRAQYNIENMRRSRHT